MNVNLKIGGVVIITGIIAYNLGKMIGTFEGGIAVLKAVREEFFKDIGGMK